MQWPSLLGLAITAPLVYVAGSGCGPAYPVEAKTEHLSIAKTFDAPLCGATVRALERDAARISERLGAEARAPVELVLGAEAVLEHCPPGARGCALFGGPVWTDFAAAGHELVHAFAGVPAGGGVPFVEEGLAEALGGGFSSIHRLEVDAAEASIVDAFVEVEAGDDAGYELAGHFSVWLIERWGLERLLEFRLALGESPAGPAITEAFEAVYGLSLEQAEASWRTTAPPSYVIGEGDCAGPSEAWVDARRWRGELRADCSASHTFGPLGGWTAVEAGMRRTMIVDVVHRGSYTITADASRAGALELDPISCGCWSGPELLERRDLSSGVNTFALPRARARTARARGPRWRRSCRSRHCRPHGPAVGELDQRRIARRHPRPRWLG